MENIIILQGIKLESFLASIDMIVEKRLNEKMELIAPKKDHKYLCRKEVCQILKVSLPTLSDWTAKGLINSYRIGSRILYKSDEVEAALIKRKFRI